MADLRIDGNQLVLHLSGAERVEGVHGDLRVPLSAVVRDLRRHGRGGVSGRSRPGSGGVRIRHWIRIRCGWFGHDIFLRAGRGRGRGTNGRDDHANAYELLR